MKKYYHENVFLVFEYLSCLLLLRNGTIDKSEKFEDTRGAIRSHKSRKDRQYNVQKKRGKSETIIYKALHDRATRTPLKIHPGTLKIERLESQIIYKSLGAIQPKNLNWIVKIKICCASNDNRTNRKTRSLHGNLDVHVKW